ncbi:hypothetical protein QBC38DRAFT_428809 [Podospora fimiseda]|uniref:18S rRNA factor 2 n=1 Tax=Podospora fimiseda TaxID=252190 RepID=A0AAN6YNI8_9PEZI|nr:hypothetical protein QBC38DRAFT_428809 [Podospora fimiseda]
MPGDIRNELLNAGDSDNELVHHSDSDDGFQKGGRSAKRRRVTSDDEDQDSDVSEDEQDDQQQEQKQKQKEDNSKPSKSEEDSNTFKKQKQPKLPDLNLPVSQKSLLKKNLIVTESAIKKSGVIYLSRVPPFMKPQKLRSLLEPYGQINRIFLAPEDPAEHARRVKAGGNKKRSYSEGWVEFLKKKDAKKVVDLLNAQTIGGKKSSWYRDDVWSLKYLSGFKWHNLTEQIAAETAERQSRMMAEISRSAKENKEFVKNVERAKVLNGIEGKKRKKNGGDEDEGGKEETGGGGDGEGEGQEQGKQQQRRRTFTQVPTVKKRKMGETEGGDQVQRVLTKIF